MRLLHCVTGDQLVLTKDILDDYEIPPYAILSHTWEDGQEVTFNDMTNGIGHDKTGYEKIQFCRLQAKSDGLQYFWVDTCCIDKSNHVELQHAINSMFYWYQNAQRCYVYLSDVSTGKRKASGDTYGCTWETAFRDCRWFTRGFCLQELLAPRTVEFFSREGRQLGDKNTLEKGIEEITGIPVSALQGTPLCSFTVEERFSWAKSRQTTRKEDKAYSLLGIFGVFMQSNYGEGEENAFRRLRSKIERNSRNKAFALQPLLSSNEFRESEQSLSTSPLDESQKQTLLESLRFDQIDTRRMDIKRAHAKTCEWLMLNSEYMDWLDTTKFSEHHGLLWIKGKPGAGKSTIMKFAVEHVRQATRSRTIISFFFHGRGVALEKSTTGAYRSLLLQLFEKNPALQKAFDKLHISVSSIHKYYQWNVESLKLILEEALMCLGESSVVCFIDALDECKENEIRDMMAFFEHMGELAVSNNIKFCVCFSSRHYPHITIEKGLSLVLEGDEGHGQDITNYLDTELKIGHNNTAKHIRNELHEKASGIFMWVVLVVSILNKEYDRGHMHALRKRLHEIPSGLHELFQEILTRDSYNREGLLLCVQWVLYSNGPLVPVQLYYAILPELEPDTPLKWDPEEVPMDAIERFVLNCSKGLVEITSHTRKVQFIHESLKDFLLTEDSLRSICPDLSSDFRGQSHDRLKECCLTYLDFELSTHDGKELSALTPRELVRIHRPTVESFPFLSYAIYHMLYHADMAAKYGISQQDFIESFPIDHWIILYNLLEADEERMFTKDVSLLYILAFTNMPNLIRTFPVNASYLEAENERYLCPLIAALANESWGAVRAFVEMQATTLDPSSWLYQLCDEYRSNVGNPWTLGYYLQSFKRITTLSCLAIFGDTVLFALALESGKFIPDVKDEEEQTPLFWAAATGSWSIVKLLLDTGKVQADSNNKHYQTPLFLAAVNGHEAIVELLVKTDKVDVEHKDKHGQTPLFMAVFLKRIEVIKLLLSTGKANVNSMNQTGETPLSLAITLEDQDMLELLLPYDTISYRENIC